MSRDPSFHRELLEQARHLANRRPRQPRQGDLRRAVSAAYYSLFHFLIDEACRYLLGSSPDDHTLRTILARAFLHAEMAGRPVLSKAERARSRRPWPRFPVMSRDSCERSRRSSATSKLRDTALTTTSARNTFPTTSTSSSITSRPPSKGGRRSEPSRRRVSSSSRCSSGTGSRRSDRRTRRLSNLRPPDLLQ